MRVDEMLVSTLIIRARLWCRGRISASLTAVPEFLIYSWNEIRGGGDETEPQPLGFAIKYLIKLLFENKLIIVPWEIYIIRSQDI